MEALLTNPILIIILIGVLSRIIKQTKNAKEQNSKPLPLPPVMKREPRAANDQTAKIKNQKRTPRPSVEQNMQGIKAALSEQSSSAVLRATEPATTPVKHEENDFQLETNNEALLQGIIWSEVFGKPRSKKPYYAERRYTHDEGK